MGADGPDVVVEAMDSGAHGFHVTSLVLFRFCILQRMWPLAWEQRSLLGKVFSRQKSVYPFLTCTVLQVYTEVLFIHQKNVMFIC
jgi:hypothetical protein